MKRRYIYMGLFGIPGLLVAAILALALFGVTVGVLWLFVFGDNPWPDITNSALAGIVLLAFLGMCAISLRMGYQTGKRHEQDAMLNKSHVLLSAGLTALLLLLMLGFQVSNGNLSPKSAETRCGDFCSAKGYA
ncbi:MAG: hypothetical protein ACM3MF_12170, partial [Anaerolineae bacterium]